MENIPYEKGSGNVFADLGFAPAATAVLTMKSTLITVIGDTIKERNLTQQEAAKLCGTDQPTLSKILRGRMESVTIDKLTEWLEALGRTVVISVAPSGRKTTADQLKKASFQARPKNNRRSGEMSHVQRPSRDR